MSKLSLNEAESVLQRRNVDLEGLAIKNRETERVKKAIKKTIRKSRGAKSLGKIVSEDVVANSTQKAKYYNEKRLRENSNIMNPSMTRGPGFVCPEKYPILLVVRNSLPCYLNSALRELSSYRLKRYYSGVLVPNNRETMMFLHAYSNYVFWGCVEPEMLHRLVTARGFVKGDGEEVTVSVPKGAGDESKDQELIDAEQYSMVTRLYDTTKKVIHTRALSSNLIIEEVFADEGFLSIQDLIHELSKGKTSFDVIYEKLLPFIFDFKNEGSGAEIVKQKGMVVDLNDRIKKMC